MITGWQHEIYYRYSAAVKRWEVWCNQTSWIQDETGIAAPRRAACKIIMRKRQHEASSAWATAQPRLHPDWLWRTQSRSCQCKVRSCTRTVLTVVLQLPAFCTRLALSNIKINSGSKTAAHSLQCFFLLHSTTLSNYKRYTPLRKSRLRME